VEVGCDLVIIFEGGGWHQKRNLCMSHWHKFAV